MPPQDPFERLTILERAQFLHDATLRRHGDMLDRSMDAIARHEEALLRHHSQLAALRTMAEAQHATLHRLEALSTQLTDSQIALSATLASHTSRLSAVEEAILRIAQTLDAIKDMLNRPNGH